MRNTNHSGIDLQANSVASLAATGSRAIPTAAFSSGKPYLRAVGKLAVIPAFTSSAQRSQIAAIAPQEFGADWVSDDHSNHSEHSSQAEPLGPDRKEF
ncbi:hypothetical protein OKW41_002755 [Paraburkholderia sp. UCT70]|uniref:hypothetical protein n=1 Tax=Paraburkholderia sp. UCT70 TaxID=2991068 RepID=UPI003D191239